jgi:hypothetical protein
MITPDKGLETTPGDGRIAARCGAIEATINGGYFMMLIQRKFAARNHSSQARKSCVVWTKLFQINLLRESNPAERLGPCMTGRIVLFSQNFRSGELPIIQKGIILPSCLLERPSACKHCEPCGRGSNAMGGLSYMKLDAMGV